MDHRTIVSFFTCQLVWVNRYTSSVWSFFEHNWLCIYIFSTHASERQQRHKSVDGDQSRNHQITLTVVCLARWILNLENRQGYVSADGSTSAPPFAFLDIATKAMAGAALRPFLARLLI